MKNPTRRRAVVRRVFLFLVIATLIATFDPAVLRCEPVYRVIVHPSNPVDRLTREELADLFLKKTVLWDHGAAVVAVDLHKSSPTRAAFSTEVLNRDVASVEHYWTRQVFSGRDVPPQELGQDSEVVAFVAGRPGAVGYVARSSPIPGVKPVGVLAPPEPLSQPPPRYPFAAERANRQGDVVLRIVVDPRGQVTRVTPIAELPFGLTEAAVAAVRQWRYVPAKLDGESVEWAIDVTVHFTLK